MMSCVCQTINREKNGEELKKNEAPLCHILRVLLVLIIFPPHRRGSTHTHKAKRRRKEYKEACCTIMTTLLSWGNLHVWISRPFVLSSGNILRAANGIEFKTRQIKCPLGKYCKIVVSRLFLFNLSFYFVFQFSFILYDRDVFAFDKSSFFFYILPPYLVTWQVSRQTSLCITHLACNQWLCKPLYLYMAGPDRLIKKGTFFLWRY